MSQIFRHELLMNDQCLQNNNQGSLVTNKKNDTCYFTTFDDHHDTSIVNRPSTALSDRYYVTPWDSGIRSTSAALRTNAALRISAALLTSAALRTSAASSICAYFALRFLVDNGSSSRHEPVCCAPATCFHTE